VPDPPARMIPFMLPPQSIEVSGEKCYLGRDDLLFNAICVRNATQRKREFDQSVFRKEPM